MICSLADFNIEYENKCKWFKENFCADYISCGKADFTLEVTEDDIIYENSIAEGTFGKHYIETLAFYRKLADTLPTKNAFLLHSAMLRVQV